MSNIKFEPNGHFGINGITIHPGSDVDADLITVDVAPGPVFKWDESAGSFGMNAGLRIQPATDLAQALEVIKQSNSKSVFLVDTITQEVKIQINANGDGLIFYEGGTETGSIERTGTRTAGLRLRALNGDIKVRMDANVAANNYIDTTGTFGLGTPSATAKFHVVGANDIVQTIIKAHSTQTANLQEWQASNAAILSHINADGSFHFGDASNNLQISAGGILTLAGSAKRWLAIRPDLDYTVITAQGKPTQVVIGVFHGYSMPVYVAAQNEELFFNIHVPGRWDEASNPVVHLLVALAGAEDVDDNFKFQISWEHLTEEDSIPVTSHDVEVEQAILTDRNAQYSTYELQFAIDYDVDTPDNLTDHDDLAFRLRRIDATNPDITNEVIILDYHVEFRVDKMFDGDAI